MVSTTSKQKGGKMAKTFSIPYKNFEKLCRENKLTAYEVAKATGVTSATLSSWKYGDYVPKLEKLIALADFFGVEITYFIERKKTK